MSEAEREVNPGCEQCGTETRRHSDPSGGWLECPVCGWLQNVRATAGEGRLSKGLDAVGEAWRVEAMRANDELRVLRRLAGVLGDLNRCEHGRHEGDVCSGVSGCNGPSKGNPLLTGATNRLEFTAGVAMQLPARTIGFDISRNPIVVPERERMHEREAWSPHR